MPNENGIEALKNYEAEIAEPYSSLIENFRAFGYSLPDALADIIDNSIAAGAKNVWIRFTWKSDKSFISITDDGSGMTKDDLVEALRPGTKNPFADRKEEDLGRFGLGLKSASFSQCRRLTVISKKADSAISYRTWDLDYVEQCKKWQLLNYISDPSLAEELNGKSQGTIVIWEKPDRILYDQNKQLIPSRKFLELIREAEQHLSMVFHRFIEKATLKLWINDTIVPAWNPFLLMEEATQSFPTEEFGNGDIRITGFVLPHVSKIGPEKYKKAEGINGWTAQQGFYIYRKDRMLVTGDWLGIFRKEDVTRLARIVIEMDARLDFAWQLDIRKSRAVPPKIFRDQLKRYAAGVRKAAIDVYNFRGKNSVRKADSNTKFEFAWITEQLNDRQYFRINRNHTLVKSLMENPAVPKRELKALLLLLETTLPVPAILLNENQNNDRPSEAGIPATDAEITGLIQTIYDQLLKKGKSPEEAVEELYTIEPLSDFPHLVEAFRNQISDEKA